MDAMILVDEAFGAAVLSDAAARGFITCVSTEKSGQDEFDFEYGDEFAQAVSRWLTIAAGVHGFVGGAVGRTTWLDAVMQWRAHTFSREIAVARIAKRVREWAAIFEHASVR